MTPAEKNAFQEMRELSMEDDSEDWIMLPDILDGSVPLDMSHEGGEFEGLTEEYRKRYGYVVSFSVIIF
jgi:hypothetical protein